MCKRNNIITGNLCDEQSTQIWKRKFLLQPLLIAILKYILCSVVHFLSVCYIRFFVFLFVCRFLLLSVLAVFHMNWSAHEMKFSESKIYTRNHYVSFPFLSFCANALISPYRNTYVNKGKHKSMEMLAISIISFHNRYYIYFSYLLSLL